MSDWKAKRFWKEAKAVECPGGFTVTLDDRSVKTPAKAALVLPTMAMAQAAAIEWDAQEEAIDPRTMPITRGANAAIDKVGAQRDEVVNLLAEYGESDLLCYRATGPDELIALQAASWDPVLAWAREVLNAPLAVGEGVMHIPQDPASLVRLKSEVAAFSDFELAAVHDLISMSGSLVLALAVTKNYLNASDAWALSRIDEQWQISQWGDDDEALVVAEIKKASFLDAASFFELSQA